MSTRVNSNTRVSTWVRNFAARFPAGAALAALMLGASVQAGAAATNVGTFDFWTVWSDTEGGSRICYISSTPQDSQPTNVNRGAIHFIVTKRPGNANEISTLIGYPFHDTNANASATIDGRNYPMVTENNAAWLASLEDEATFVAGMRAGSTLVVRGTSQRGTNTTDTYSLRGVTAALNRLNQECN